MCGRRSGLPNFGPARGTSCKESCSSDPPDTLQGYQARGGHLAEVVGLVAGPLDTGACPRTTNTNKQAYKSSIPCVPVRTLLMPAFLERRSMAERIGHVGSVKDPCGSPEGGGQIRVDAGRIWADLDQFWPMSTDRFRPNSERIRARFGRI